MDWEQQRAQLISQLKQQGYLTKATVAKAMQQVPREKFVDRSQVAASQIYRDRPLPIGHGQTVSAPHMVAWQTCLLNPQPQDIVLEIGAGLGYQAAVLAALVDKIITLEVVPELAEAASNNLKEYDNVKVVSVDGSRGYQPEAPYDKIVVTCAAPALPEPLRQQLKAGGLIVIPLGDKHSQRLKRMKKTEEGFDQEDLGAVRFVPLRGELGFKD